MKKLLLLLLFAPLLICGNCKKKNVNPNTEPEAQLPPVTTTGENTFGCIINGEVWVKPWFGGKLSGAYDNPPGDFLIFASDLRKDESFRMELYGRVFELGTYDLYDSTLSFSPIPFAAGRDSEKYAGSYVINSTYNGTITILRADTASPYIIAGTFEFEAVNDSGEVVKVTDGRFDYRYGF